MFAGFDILHDGTRAGEVVGEHHQFGEVDRKFRRQCRLHRGRLSRIDPHRVAAAGVDTRLMEGVFQIHAVIDQEGADLGHRRHDLASARGADGKPAFAIARGNHRTHIGQRTLGRPEVIG